VNCDSVISLWPFCSITELISLP